MEKRSEVLEELKVIAPSLAGLKQQDAFSVPENYFSILPNNLLAKIKEEEAWESAAELQLSPLLQSLKTKPSFELPAQYFSASTASIISKIRKEEVAQDLTELAPQLAQLPKQIPFLVPENYFASLANSVLNIVQKEELEVEHQNAIWDKLSNFINTVLAPLLRPNVAYIGAFASLLFIFSAFWLAKEKTDNNDIWALTALETNLSSISTKEISNYIAQNIDEFDEALFKKSETTTSSNKEENTQINNMEPEDYHLDSLDEEDLWKLLNEHNNKNGII